MKLLLLFGDAAVGKMTVGQELCKITDFRLFHNHMTIEPVLKFLESLMNLLLENSEKLYLKSSQKVINTD